MQKSKNFGFEDPSEKQKLSIITLMEEMKPIVMEKREIEYWAMSKLLSTS